jgi:xylulokinase
VLAIDLGTTETKAGLVTPDGRLLAIAGASYPLDRTPAGLVEQDPQAWWSAVRETVRAVLMSAPEAPILAICSDGQAPTLVATDADGRPTRPAISWMDVRAAEERRLLGEAIGLAGWGLANLPPAFWVERNEPTVARRTRWYLESWEWLTLRLTARAASTRLPAQPVADPDGLRAAGLPPERLAPPIAVGSIVGPLRAEPARELGLPPGIPVVAGVNDGHASFLGAGLSEPGDAIDTGGTSGGFGVCVDREIEVPGALIGHTPLLDRWVVGGAMAATGKALEWFRDDVLGGARSTEVLVAEAAATPPGAEGLVFLPYLAGERSPIWDPRARGAFAGLTLGHARGHLVRAILEAAALSIRHVAEPILAAGVEVREMRVCGGTARSREWNRIKADVTGFRVAVPEVVDTALMGSAVLAAVAVGWHANLPSAMTAMAHVGQRIEPRPELAPTYDRLYRTYTALYPSLRSVLP